MKRLVSAVSVGILEGEALLDLCYVEDKDAEVDMNLVMTDQGEFVEVQGPVKRPCSRRIRCAGCWN